MRNPLTIRADGNKTLVAHFAPTIWEEVSLTVFVDPPEGGTVTGGGRHQKGRVSLLTVHPNPGWAFVRWSADVDATEESVSILLDADKRVTAHLVAKEGGEETITPLGRAFGLPLTHNRSSEETEQQKGIPVKRPSIPKWANDKPEGVDVASSQDEANKQSEAQPSPSRNANDEIPDQSSVLRSKDAPFKRTFGKAFRLETEEP